MLCCQAHIDAGQHGEAPGTDESEAERDEDADPEPDGDEVPAIPLRSELSTADLKYFPNKTFSTLENQKVHLEDLHLPFWEVNLAGDCAVGVERPELARGGAGEAQTYRGVHSVSLPRPPAHVELGG